MQQQPPQDWQPTTTGWPPQAPPRNRRLRNALASGAFTLAVFAAGYAAGSWDPLSWSSADAPAQTSASSSPTTAAISVTGSLAVKDGFGEVGEPCETSDGYDDLAVGTQVTVTDEAGTVLAVANLEEGSSTGSTCEFPFTISVPPGHKFYGFEVSRRGVIRYTESQVRSGSVSLSIG